MSFWKVALFLLMMAPLGAAEKPLIAITSADNPPYMFMKQGKIAGFEADLCRAIGEKLQRLIEIHDMAFSGVIPALQAGRADFAIATITITEERRRNVGFSVAYENSTPSALLFPVTAHWDLKPGEVMVNLDILQGKTIGAQMGSLHEFYISRLPVKNMQVRDYDHVTMLVEEIRKSARGPGVLDAVILGKPEAMAAMAQNPELTFCLLPFSGATAIAFPQNSPLVEPIDGALQQLEISGELDALREKWRLGK